MKAQNRIIIELPKSWEIMEINGKLYVFHIKKKVVIGEILSGKTSNRRLRKIIEKISKPEKPLVLYFS